MTTQEKAMAWTMAVPKTTTSASCHSTTATIPYWLASHSTTAVCVVSLVGPMAAALSGLIEGGRQ